LNINEEEGTKNAPQSLLTNLKLTALEVIITIIKFNGTGLFGGRGEFDLEWGKTYLAFFHKFLR
jgi:hypothetical protein